MDSPVTSLLVDSTARQETSIENAELLKKGQVIKFRKPYALRDGSMAGEWEYAQVGRPGNFHTASGKGHGYELHVEVSGTSGHRIMTLSQEQLDEKEVQIHHAVPEEIKGKKFAFEDIEQLAATAETRERIKDL